MKAANKAEVEVATATAAVGTATQNFFQKYGGSAASGGPTVGSFLKFSKFGEYRHGSYDEQLALGTQLAVYMNSFCIGWTRWESNRPAERIMGPLAEGFVPPKRAELGHHEQAQWERDSDGRARDPWQFTNTVVLKPVDSDEVFYTFSTASKGGLAALGKLALEFGNRMRSKPDEYPVVELDRDSYQHSNKAYGEIRVPVFTVVGWVPAATLPPLEGFESSAALPKF
jgi:hypothetical protein